MMYGLSTEDFIGFIIDVIEAVALLSLATVCIIQSRKIRMLQAIWPAIARMIDVETKKNIEHQKVFEKLANPDEIMADMERSAVAMEALNAKRQRNIRVDAGPHARIYRPRLRSKLPGSVGKKNRSDASTDSDA